MSDTPDPWGPHRATIEDHLASCADNLSRLRRSLAGEVAPDRHYLADKAHQLHSSARPMVHIVQDVNRRLGECAATVEHDEADGRRLITERTLPAGHQGRHDDGAVSLAGRRTTTCASWPTQFTGAERHLVHSMKSQVRALSLQHSLRTLGGGR
jgi:hypothetical protein